MPEPETKEPKPLFTPEQLVTPPSCPPLVGGFGPETPEAKEAREAAGDPPPKPFKLPQYEKPAEGHHGIRPQGAVPARK